MKLRKMSTVVKLIGLLTDATVSAPDDSGTDVTVDAEVDSCADTRINVSVKMALVHIDSSGLTEPFKQPEHLKFDNYCVNRDRTNFCIKKN